MHFFNPAPVLPLVEVVRTELAADDAVRARLRVRRARSASSRSAATTRPGFVVNRILIPLLNDCVRVLDEAGVSPEDLDKAMRFGVNWPIGPCALIDLIGIDIHVHASEALHAALGEPRMAPPERLVRMAEEGRLGRKTGRGFFEYDGLGRQARAALATPRDLGVALADGRPDLPRLLDREELELDGVPRRRLDREHPAARAGAGPRASARSRSRASRGGPRGGGGCARAGSRGSWPLPRRLGRDPWAPSRPRRSGRPDGARRCRRLGAKSRRSRHGASRSTTQPALRRAGSGAGRAGGSRGAARTRSRRA